MKTDSGPEATSTEVLLTRTQAARRLKVSLSTIRRMEGEELSPIVVDGKHLFRPCDLERYVRADPGEVAAAVFADFERGATPVEVVVAHRLLPQRVEELHAAWVRMSQRVAVDLPSHRTRSALEDTYGTPRLTPAALCCAVELCAGTPERLDEWKRHLRRRFPNRQT